MKHLTPVNNIQTEILADLQSPMIQPIEFRQSVTSEHILNSHDLVAWHPKFPMNLRNKTIPIAVK